MTAEEGSGKATAPPVGKASPTRRAGWVVGQLVCGLPDPFERVRG